MKKFLIAAAIAVTTGIGFKYWINSRLEEGIVAFKLQRYEDAAELLTPLVFIGDETAEQTLGLAYAYGLGVDVDSEKAYDLLSESLNDPKAIYLEISQTYKSGNNEVMPNDELSEYWLKLSQNLN